MATTARSPRAAAAARARAKAAAAAKTKVIKEPTIISLEDFTESINMLVYSDPGVGKTVWSADDGALILATEKGTISAKRRGSKAKMIKCFTWEAFVEAYEWLESLDEIPFTWVVVDSITGLQRNALKWILRTVVEENGLRDPDIPAQGDHQKWQNIFKRYVDYLNDLPVNVLYTATAMRREDQEGNDLILPDIYGKDYQIANFVCAAMGVVGYMKKTATSKGDDAITGRKILFESMPPYFAKDRYDCLGRWVVLSQGNNQLTTLADVTRVIEQSGGEQAAAARAAKTTPAKRAPRRVPATRKAAS